MEVRFFALKRQERTIADKSCNIHDKASCYLLNDDVIDIRALSAFSNYFSKYQCIARSVKLRITYVQVVSLSRLSCNKAITRCVLKLLDTVRFNAFCY